MAIRFRKIRRKFVAIVTVVTVVLFLLTCLIPYLNPVRWWVITFLGFVFPFLFLVLLSLLLLWLYSGKRKWVLVCLMVMVLGWKNIYAMFSWHFSASHKVERSDDTIRVMTWNVQGFVNYYKTKNPKDTFRNAIMNEIEKQSADIVCLQEFSTSDYPQLFENLNYLKDTLGFKYSSFAVDFIAPQNLLYRGIVIVSKYPIIDSGAVKYPSPTIHESLLHVDIKKGNDTIRVYTTHLQSVQFNKRDYEGLHNLKNQSDPSLTAGKTILSKLKRGFVNRSIQARLVKEELDKSPHPKIICGDFNDIPNSYTYFTIKGNMQDAFLKAGFGLGRTFSGLSPTLRIDYLFADDEFKVKQIYKIRKRLSDHYPLIIDLELKK